MLRRLAIYVVSSIITLLLFAATVVIVHRWKVAVYGEPSSKPKGVIWIK